jgi:hypothetical protein
MIALTLRHHPHSLLRSAIYISFGGLLMRLKGDATNLRKPGLDMDSKQYLLMRKA